MARRMPGWLRSLLLGPTAAQADADRREAYRQYIERMEYDAARVADDAEHARIRERIAEMDRRLGDIERSVSASEAELKMHARTIQ